MIRDSGLLFWATLYTTLGYRSYVRSAAGKMSCDIWQCWSATPAPKLWNRKAPPPCHRL